MAEQILIRNLPPGTKAALKRRARKHGRSVEAELRALISAEVQREPATMVDLLWATDGLDIEFEPSRLGTTARTADL